ncbi:hypothetical protein IV417_07950 [Alphaproteobacteria bacterium KMM 3653]|uniref:Glycosyl transferase CAP10 domain-containing protein n=1 Tax=Harenicola maris TaxID=2841044 RepID=A0AAP2G8B5_9RHOB|nr:hypothetical protein [Harenicola maris]
MATEDEARRVADFPKLILLGYPSSGARRIAQAVSALGENAILGFGGKLAERIALGRLTGRAPFDQWPRARMYADLELIAPPCRPWVEGYRAFDWLHHWYPEALFVLNTRAEEDWVARLWARDEGRYRAHHAARRGVAQEALPEIWLREREAHHAAVRGYFDGQGYREQGGFTEVTAEEPLEQVLERLSRRPSAPAPRGAPDAPAAPAVSRGGGAIKPSDPAFVQSLVAHCLPRSGEGALADQPDGRMVQGHWDGQGAPLSAEGKDLGLTLVETRQGGRFLADSRGHKAVRGEGFLNDYALHGGAGPVWFDMGDARRFGGAVKGPEHPHFMYNRRPAACNVTLWPLPGHHDPGLAGSFRDMGGEGAFGRGFAHREDRVIWRGALSGQMRYLDEGGVLRHRGAFYAINRLREDPQADVSEGLESLVRYRLTRRMRGRAGYDLGVTLPRRQGFLADLPCFKGVIAEPVPMRAQANCRYILSLSGYDAGSNFPAAICAGSLVIKEEDGWEKFYTGAFRPMEHYLPMALGGGDLEDRVDWARAHPEACAEMVRAGQSVAMKLADPANIGAMKQALIEDYAARV